MKLAIYLLLIIGHLFACSNSSFKGKASKKTPETEKSQDSTPVVPGTPEQTPTPTPQGEPANDPGPSILDNLIDVIQDGLQKIPDLDFNPELPDLNINFGRLRKFHIGDGEMDNSSCKTSLTFRSLKGKTYFFEFFILEDQTQVDINIGTLCGVDYPDSNFAYFYQNQTQLAEKNIPKGAERLAFGQMTLNRGAYYIVVQSAPNSGQNPNTAPNDCDDFIVGDIKIDSLNGKKIQAGEVSFE